MRILVLSRPCCVFLQRERGMANLKVSDDLRLTRLTTYVHGHHEMLWSIKEGTWPIAKTVPPCERTSMHFF